MADVKKILGNVALPEYSRLVYHLDSEGDGVRITNVDDHRVFSVRIDSETIVLNSEGNLTLPIDRQTITVNSEGYLVAAGLTASEGEAIKIDMDVIDGVSQATISVRYDSETIVLDSENRLTVPIDHETIVINSEGKLVAIPEPLYDGVATKVHFGTQGWDSEKIDVLYDSETLRVDSENRLFVPIDHELVVVNSEELISLAIDKKTIIFENSEIQTRIGGWREDPVDTTFFTVNEAAPTEVITVVPTSIPEVGDEVTVEITMDVAGLPQSETKTFTLVANGDYLEGLDASGTLIDGVRFRKDHSEAELILDPTRVASGSNLVAVVHGETYVYHKVIGKYLPTDDETIFVNDNLDLQVIYRIDEERAMRFDDSEKRLWVAVDGETIGYDSEGRLTGTKKLEAILPVYITSEGDSEGEQKIKLLYELPLDITSEGILTVLRDGETIVLNSEGQLKVNYNELKALEVDSENMLAVKVDGLTVQFNSEGKLVAFPEPLHDGIATRVVYGTSEWDSEAIDVLYDSEKGLEVDSENRLFIKVDDDTVRFNSEGELEAKTILEGIANHIYDSEGDLKIDVLFDEEKGLAVDSENRLFIKLDPEKAVDFDSEGKLFVKADEKSVFYNSEGQLEIKVDEFRALEITSEGKVAVKVDDLSIKFNSEGKLYAIPEPLFDGVATRVNPKTTEYDSESVDVLFNSEAGLRVNSENELEVVLDSEGLGFTSEGAIRLVFDHETIVLDSEGQLSVPIDNETIRINSEGLLEADALPKPYLADTFLYIPKDSEDNPGEPEWHEAKINGVSLKGDNTTEDVRIIKWCTSEEYQAIVDAGEVYDYTLYVVNDNSPIVPEDKDYEELINKPEINGVQLSGNKSLASFGIQPILTAGTAISLQNNTIDLSYLSGVLGVDTSNRLFADTYTTEQIDNMLASLRTIKYSATKPAVGVRNTLYYVGTAAPYDMWLYDSYGTEIYLGTSSVQMYSAGQGILISSSNVISADLNNNLTEGTSSAKAPTSAAVVNYAEHKTNKVTSLAATSTNEQYPGAKLVYDELNMKVGAVAPDDNSLEILQGTTLRHKEPTNLGPAGTIGSATSIPQITYDKFGHIQQAVGIAAYPPTTAGMNGQLWVSDGVEAGAWTSLSNLMRIKYNTGSTTTSGSGTIVIDGPAPDAGYKRLCCVGAFVSSNVPGVCWSITAMSDAQVTIFVNGWTGTETITANSIWLYVREASV